MSSLPIRASDLSSPPLVKESSTRLVFQMALRDVSVLFRTPWIIITRGLAFVIQLFVFAYLISGLIQFPRLNFFHYYSHDIVVSIFYSLSFLTSFLIFQSFQYVSFYN